MDILAYPLCRSELTMGILEAFIAGRNALTTPVNRAIVRPSPAMVGVTPSDRIPGMKGGATFRITLHNRPARRQPIAAAVSAITAASARIIPRIAEGVKPS